MDALTPPNMLQGAGDGAVGGGMSPLQQLQALPPEPPKPVTHDVKIVTTRKSAQAKCLGIPPEEFGIERNARTIKDCNYCFHETIKSVSELTAQGFDAAQLNDLTTAGSDNTTETLSRDSVDESMIGRDTLNDSARPIRVTEHYIRVDYEGNGKACIYRVTTAGEGGDILKRDGKDDIERVDVYPFASITPVPVTHRFFGRSIADLVMAVQREKTALKRGALDNLYLHNNPRVEVSEANAGPNTLDDLLVSRSGGVVRTKTAGGLNWQVVPDITGSIYPMMQYLDAELETKTGVSKQSQGIDANALQNQSATAVAQVFSSSQMRMKLIARICAEGVKDMFALLHGVIRKHGQQAQTVRLRNTWVQVDPRNWKTRQDMTIHVGLGTGGKAQQFAQVMALGNFQKELLLGGKANLVDDQALFNTGTELVKIMGYKNPDKFINDPSAKDPQTGQLMHPPVPPPEDPKVTALKLKAETDQQAAQQKAAIEKLQAEADIATQDRKTQAEIALADRKAKLEAELKMLEFQMKREEHSQKMDLAHQQHQQTIEQGQLGMAATAHAHDSKMAQNEQANSAKIEQMKAKPAAGKAKASIEVKHGADQITGPMADVVKQLGQHVVASTQQNTNAILAALKEHSRPKRVVRGKDGRVSHVEPI